MSEISNTSYTEYIFEIQRVLNIHLALAFLPFGILLNLFSIYVFTRKKFQNNKFSYLSIWLILVETNSVLTGFFPYKFLPAIGIDFYLSSELNCKILTYVRRICIQSASWSQVTCALDRFLSVKFPNKIDLLKNKWKNVFIITTLILCSLSIVNIGNLFYKLDSTLKNNITQTACIATLEGYFVTDMLSVLMRNILPFTLMLSLNVIIAKEFIQSKNKLGKNSNNQREWQFTFTIICTNCIFFLLQIPLLVMYIIDNIYRIYPSSNENQKAAIVLALDIATFVSFLNNILPFCINVTFNKLFRSETRIIISKCLLIYKEPHRVISDNLIKNTSV